MKNLVYLFTIRLKADFFEFIEFLRVVWRYYWHVTYACNDLSLIFPYLFHNPFRVSKAFLQKEGATHLYGYGETPLTSFERIAYEADLQPADVFYELGCGRGRVCLWAHEFIGCKVIGVDYVPTFIDRAKKIEKPGLSFYCEDFFKIPLEGATVIYLYGTSLDDDQVTLLAQRFSELPSGTRFITISYPLTDYVPNEFEVMKRFSVPFTWGEADVYLQFKR